MKPSVIITIMDALEDTKHGETTSSLGEMLGYTHQYMGYVIRAMRKAQLLIENDRVIFPLEKGYGTFKQKLKSAWEVVKIIEGNGQTSIDKFHEGVSS